MTDATVFSERLGVRRVNASPTRRNRGDLLSGPGKAVAILRDGESALHGVSPEPQASIEGAMAAVETVPCWSAQAPLPEQIRVETGDRAWHTGGMSHEEVYPYTLDVQPCDKPAGHFRWIIRERGKLLQRSDRFHASEEAALKSGRAELERVATVGRGR